MAALSPRSAAACLAAIVAAALALAAFWALRVPFFQQPDELAHADYAFALYDAGRPFVLRGAHPEHEVTPQIHVLARAVEYQAWRYNPELRAPQNYGTLAFWRALDAQGPPRSARPPAPGSPLPYVAFLYPAGYYALLAAAMALFATLAGDSPAAAMLLARFCNVAFLAITLLAAYGIARELRASRAASLLAVAGIGFLPLTSWVSGYVQPDNLSCALMALTVWLALRCRTRACAAPETFALVATLCIFPFVKQQYALFALLAAAPVVVLSRSPALVRAAIVALPALCFPLAMKAVPLETFPALHTVLGALPLRERLAHAPLWFVYGVRDVYFGGAGFNDFWLHFGVHSANGWIFAQPLQSAVTLALQIATLGLFALWLLRRRRVLLGIARVARRKPVCAARLLVCDPALSTYLLCTIFLLGLFAFEAGDMRFEGRYWLPVLAPLVATSLASLTRAFPPSARARALLWLAGTWAASSAAAAAFALGALQATFYAPAPPPQVEPYAQIAAAAQTLRVRRGAALAVDGFAIDGERGLPADAVDVVVDGTLRARAVVHQPSPRAALQLNDAAVADAGFSATLQTGTWAYGPHVVTALVREARRPDGLPARGVVAVEIVR